MSRLSDFISGYANSPEIITPYYTRELHIATNGQRVFNLLNSYTPGYQELELLINGLKQTPDNYTYEETGTHTVTMTEGLVTGDDVLFQQLKYTGDLNETGNLYLQEIHTAFAGQSVFTLSTSYQAGLIEVYVQGVFQTPDRSSYVETNNTTITFSEGLNAEETVVFKILKDLNTAE